MSNKPLRVVSINFWFADRNVVQADLDSDRALFDFDIVVIRPPQFPVSPGRPNDDAIYRHLNSVMEAKKRELDSLFCQGGVLVVFLDAPDYFEVTKQIRRSWVTNSVNNYDFLDATIAACLVKGKGNQVNYSASAEPFVAVLKKSVVEWTAYLTRWPSHLFGGMKFFAQAGAAGSVAGRASYKEGHIILLPNIQRLDEESFFNVCAEYRFKKQGTTPPDWARNVLVPGLPAIESAITDLDKQLADLQDSRQLRERELEDKSAYRKLLYEKGKAQLEPIVLRGLDDLDFGTSPGELIEGTIHEIDGRTSKGSSPGIIEVKGSKNQIVQSEFSPFVTKILADSDIKKAFSKGILVGNGLCETEPIQRLGDSVFSQHVIEGAKRHSVALVNSVELFWLCCALLRGDTVDRAAVREAILAGSGYVDLRPYAGKSPF